MEKDKKENQKISMRDVFYFTLLLVIMFVVLYLGVKFILDLVIYAFERIGNVASNMDSVVIVAIITGGISIVTVIISSVISKIIEYKQNINKYLYEKREEPYSKFISMIYKR